MTSSHHILGSISILGLVFGYVCSIGGCLLFIFDSQDHMSRNQNTKTLKIHTVYIFLCLN